MEVGTEKSLAAQSAAPVVVTDGEPYAKTAAKKQDEAADAIPSADPIALIETLKRGASIETIAIEMIIEEPTLQSRVGLVDEVVKEYAAKIGAGEAFPEIIRSNAGRAALTKIAKRCESLAQQIQQHLDGK